MKLTWLFLFLGLTARGQSDTLSSSFRMPSHPRILWKAGEEAAVLRNISTPGPCQAVHRTIISTSEKLLGEPVLQRQMTGKRLLSVSRECLRRVFFLSYAWRTEKDNRYADRAIREMLAVSDFTDWNPSHFLDVAEMTMGVAIGYDWLYDRLTPAQRKEIGAALIEKGMRPSLEKRYSNWLKDHHNWNQVCNAGMLFGSLAVYEDAPELGLQLINRGIRSIVLPMEAYSPGGAYPEGYSYWGYGTSFNVLFISALENLTGSDFGLPAMPGFLQTAGYFQHMTGPFGLPFNFADAGRGGSLEPAMAWFAQRTNNPSLMYVEKQRLQRPDAHAGNRLLPAMLLWGKNINMQNVPAPAKTFWTAAGEMPVALMRSAWSDSSAMFIGFKGGSPSVNHAHMDVGTFVLDWGGVRWASDLGMQDYNSLESRGLSIWNKQQNSQRWQVMRYNNLVHNTLTVNNSFQLVEGHADIIATGTGKTLQFAVTDMSAVYKDQLSKAIRGIALLPGNRAVIRDEVEGGNGPDTIQWRLLTPAAVELKNDRTIILRKDGRTMHLVIDAPVPVKLRTWSTDPVHDYDAPNPGTILAGFEAIVPAGFKGAFTVHVIPEGAKPPQNVPALHSWKKWKP
ncbi:heparinase II/III domain-containing protein [Chitinophaga deserti]|uniref:heparinase II/III domain-containing protein n=1 Tax=Chitinophaga deserti TaxID=2164099 RepID=UPI000D6DB9CF|nr:heparinase II/III family protein [Chitinophaga deserti]